MARPRSDERLDQVMGLFWDRGYYDTPIGELVRRTGLHRAAVYAEFGSKQQLFEAALRRYRETITGALCAPLVRSDAALGDIERFFRGVHEAATRPGKRVGCLMVNTASEVSPHVRSVARLVSNFLTDLRALLRAACVNAQVRGEIRADADVDAIADFFVGAVLGLWTLARSPAPATMLDNYLNGVVHFVDGLRPRTERRRPSASSGARRPGLRG